MLDDDAVQDDAVHELAWKAGWNAWIDACDWEKDRGAISFACAARDELSKSRRPFLVRGALVAARDRVYVLEAEFARAWSKVIEGDVHED